MPTDGWIVGERSIWNDEHSTTWTRSGEGGGSCRIGVPMLPPIATSWPKHRKRCAVSAVVVDLPLVPVIATKGAPGAVFSRSRPNSSMSPMISTPAACASGTVQCGVGWVSGTPGASTSAAKADQSASCKSSISMPASAALSREACLSSQAAT